MEKQFVTHEIALKLKELGFDEECINEYWFTCKKLRFSFESIKNIYHYERSNSDNNDISLISAPLWQQVIDWFRDKHHTNIEINRFPNISKWGFVVTDMTIIPKQQTRKENINMSLKVADVRRFDEYFECREQAILKAIELCQKEK